MGDHLILNGFIQCSPNHQIKGMWKHPLDQTSAGYRNLKFWIRLAQLLERGCMDALFFADVHGSYDTYGGNRHAAVRHAVQFPGIDPTVLVPALAAATDHLGFGVTYSTTYFPPYQAAKLFSTLDHLTEGRVGWNVVTSYLPDAERQGLGVHLEHDERYDRADEYLDVCYKLWEQSWDEGAIVLDIENDIHTDPSKVNEIDHHGRWFDVQGPHMVEPSPQRTPVIFQAGSSARGLEFAAQHGEAVFLAASQGPAGAALVQRLRDTAEAAGRDSKSLKVIHATRMIVAETDAEAHAMRNEWERLFSVEGYLALFAGWTGIDLGGHRPDTLISSIETNAVQTITERWQAEDPEREWTVGEMARRLADGGAGTAFIGSADTVADQVEEFAETSGVDGFNLITSPVPWGLEQVVDHLVPELQRRGRLRTAYEEGETLRERWFGKGAVHPRAIR
ncbi:MAG: FMN-dependent oxidoreductase (nitrilotriacetate monooxygenase family) [Candidatus Poriferisodalaceae bacterium]|jgi:FMN-dependent oxidoreductase (nitrilotriacetate monooxygenase family)